MLPVSSWSFSEVVAGGQSIPQAFCNCNYSVVKAAPSPRSRAIALWGTPDQAIVIADRGKGAAPTRFEQVSMDKLNSCSQLNLKPQS